MPAFSSALGMAKAGPIPITLAVLYSGQLIVAITADEREYSYVVHRQRRL